MTMDWLQDARTVGMKAAVMAMYSQDDVWCINKKGEIWQWQSSSTWKQIPTHSGRADARSIAIGDDYSVWYADSSGKMYFWVNDGNAWIEDDQWQPSRMGTPAVVAVNNQADVWVVNEEGDVWHAYNRSWRKLGEMDPKERMWTYEVKAGDSMMAIMRKEFNLKGPLDQEEIARTISLITAQNPGINPNNLQAGQVLTLRY